MVDPHGLRLRPGIGVSNKDYEQVLAGIEAMRSTPAGAQLYGIVNESTTDVFVYPSGTGSGRYGLDTEGHPSMWLPKKGDARPGRTAHEFQHAAEKVSGQKDPANLGCVSPNDPDDKFGDAEPIENRAVRVENIVNDQYYSQSRFHYNPSPLETYSTREGNRSWNVPDVYGTKYKPVRP